MSLTLPAELPRDQIAQQVAAWLQPRLRPGFRPGGLSLMEPPKPVQDNPYKLLVHTACGRPAAVVLCSPPAAPDYVENGQRKAAAARQLLPSHLGDVILEPLGVARAADLSFACLPYRRPLSTARLAWLLQRRRLRGSVFKWLSEVMRATVCPLSPADLVAQVVRPLETLAAWEGLPAGIRDAARRGLGRLAGGAWRPRLSLVHNDFCRENILLPDPDSPLRPVTAEPPPFHVIDWAGSAVQGHGLYDVVRLGASFSIPRHLLRRYLAACCRSIDCELSDAIYALLAALGSIGMNLEHFPPDRFALLVRICYQTAARALHVARPVERRAS